VVGLDVVDLSAIAATRAAEPVQPLVARGISPTNFVALHPRPLTRAGVIYHPRMASRRVLVSVAGGVARAFANRNNDVEGWFAPALLMEATAPADPAYRHDLLTGETIPTSLTPALDELGPAWVRYFTWTLGRHGVPPDRVAMAALTLRFEYDRWGAGVKSRPHAPAARLHGSHQGRPRSSLRARCDQLLLPAERLRPVSATGGTPDAVRRPVRRGPRRLKVNRLLARPAWTATVGS
jgi:hypothetical protein